MRFLIIGNPGDSFQSIIGELGDTIVAESITEEIVREWFDATPKNNVDSMPLIRRIFSLHTPLAAKHSSVVLLDGLYLNDVNLKQVVRVFNKRLAIDFLAFIVEGNSDKSLDDLSRKGLPLDGVIALGSEKTEIEQKLNQTADARNRWIKKYIQRSGRKLLGFLTVQFILSALLIYSVGVYAKAFLEEFGKSSFTSIQKNYIDRKIDKVNEGPQPQAKSNSEMKN